MVIGAFIGPSSFGEWNLQAEHPSAGRSAPGTQGVEGRYLDRERAILVSVAASDDPLAPHTLSPTELKEVLAVERTGEPFLVFRDGDGTLRCHPLGQGERSWTLGRRLQMDLPIEWDPEVSGLHAELQASGGELAIVDDGLSRNGTYVDGRRVNGRRRLRDGDRIRVGQTVIVARFPAGAPLEETVTAGQTALAQELTETQRKVLVALCRPFADGTSFTKPATNQEIADEVFLSVEAVKMHLRALFAKFELTELAQNAKRVRLAECALQFGVVTRRELA
jgi:pSer/pThr/pTyr-binding forkhead associated (FHA) protein